MSKYDFDEWTKNTVLTCLAHNDNVLVLRFAHPGSLFNSETITFSHVASVVNTIVFSGDGGCAVFKPTWNPINPTDYRTLNFGYFMEKVAATDRETYTWNYDDKLSDFENLCKEDYSPEEYEYLKNVANNNEYDNGEFVAILECERSPVDSEIIEDGVELGRRYSISMYLYYELLIALSKLGTQPWKLKTGETIEIGEEVNE